jgi:hypothetical protein
MSTAGGADLEGSDAKLPANSADVYVSMFYHDDLGLIVHDSTVAEAPGRLVGIQLPFVHVLNDEMTSEDGNDRDA